MRGPDRHCLYRTTRDQFGLFTAAQARACRFSPRMLSFDLQAGHFVRLDRGVYRLAGHAPHPHEELLTLWHRFGRQGVFGGETALELHRLKEGGDGEVVSPRRIHLVLPAAWQERRLAHERHVMLHFDDVPPAHRTHVTLIPVTTVERTLRDCVRWNVDGATLRRAEEEIQRRRFAEQRRSSRMTFE